MILFYCLLQISTIISCQFSLLCQSKIKITLLNDLKIWRQFEEKLIIIVDVGAPNLWGHLKDGVLEACVVVCGKKRGRRSKGYTWWWKEEVMEAVSREKEAHKAMCQNSIEENKRSYNSKKNEASRAVS